jgi:DNA modification methylase
VRYQLKLGDCIELMRAGKAESVDAIVCDPPYALQFMGKEWDKHKTPLDFQRWCEAWSREALRVLKPGGHAVVFGGTRTFHRMTCGLEDAGFEIRDCLMYLYGSGFPKSFNLDRERGGKICGCEDPGTSPEYDLRDVPDADVPTSLPATGREGPLLLAGLPESRPSTDGQTAEQPLDDRARQPRMEGRRDLQADARQPRRGEVRESAGVGAPDGSEGRLRDGAPAVDGRDGRTTAQPDRVRSPSGPSATSQREDEPRTVADEPGSQAGGAWPLCSRCGKPAVERGLGTALKPAWEPIILARKPLTGTVAKNVLVHGTGALNIDGSRISMGDEYDPARRQRQTRSDGAVRFASGGLIGSDIPTYNEAGRWPANVVLDPEAAAQLDEQTGELVSGPESDRGRRLRRNADTEASRNAYGRFQDQEVTGVLYGDRGGASRFFYCAKTSTAERNAGLEGFEPQWAPTMGGGIGGKPHDEDIATPKVNVHPTVKPIELMRWLVRLVTPPGGLVLDPFVGSGTTGCAAALEDFNFVGFDREQEYLDIAAARIAWWQEHASAEPAKSILAAAKKEVKR